MAKTETLHVFWHPDVLKHNMGMAAFEIPPYPFLAVAEKHTEGPDRVRNMLSILKDGPLAKRIKWHKGRAATRAELLTFHTPGFLADLERVTKSKGRGKWYTRTTLFTPHSYGPVKVAAGTAIAAMDHMLDGKAKLTYALVRPPGHHASPDTADGYCFLNNTALAAQRAIERGAKRVVILDWDVHHGNGTQDAFEADPRVLYVSTHAAPFYPGSGALEERGAGNLVNVPLPHGAGDAAFLAAYEQVALPALERHRPQFILVSSGWDAHARDPLGTLQVTTWGYTRAAMLAVEAAQRLCEGRIVVALEGGYDTHALAWCASGLVEVLLGDEPTPDPEPADVSPGDALPSLIATARRLAGL